MRGVRAIGAWIADSIAKHVFLRIIKSIRLGSVTVETSANRTYTVDSGNEGPHGVLLVNDARFYRRFLAGGEIGFGE